MYFDKIFPSQAYKNFLNNYFFTNGEKSLNDVLERMYHSCQYCLYIHGSFDPYFSKEMDLYLSVGLCNVAVKILLIGNIDNDHTLKWRVTISLWDEYAFEKWGAEHKDSFAKFMNNIIGYNLQQLGVTTLYNWRIDCSYYVFFRCKHI